MLAHLLELLEGVGGAGRPAAERVAGDGGEPERPPALVLLHRRDVLGTRRAELRLAVPSGPGGGRGGGGGEEEGRGGELTKEASHGRASCGARRHAGRRGCLRGLDEGKGSGNKPRTKEGRREMEWATGLRLRSPDCGSGSFVTTGWQFARWTFGSFFFSCSDLFRLLF